jgi:hypothetical protein
MLINIALSKISSSLVVPWADRVQFLHVTRAPRGTRWATCLCKLQSHGYVYFYLTVTYGPSVSMLISKLVECTT